MDTSFLDPTRLLDRQQPSLNARQADFLLDGSGPAGQHEALAAVLDAAARTPYPTVVTATPAEDAATAVFRQAPAADSLVAAAGTAGATTLLSLDEPAARPAHTGAMPAGLRRGMAGELLGRVRDALGDLVMAPSQAAKIAMVAVATLTVGGVALASTLSGLPVDPPARSTVAAASSPTGGTSGQDPAAASDDSAQPTDPAATSTASVPAPSPTKAPTHSATAAPSHRPSATHPAKPTKAPSRPHTQGLSLVALCNSVAVAELNGGGRAARRVMSTRPWRDAAAQVGGPGRVISWCSAQWQRTCTARPRRGGALMIATAAEMVCPGRVWPPRLLRPLNQG